MSPVFGHGRLRLYLLKLLDEAPRHGYEVIRLLEDRFMGLYAPSAGTVYPRLARLEKEGLVTHSVEGGRKVYRLTDAGRAELHARLDELSDLETELGASLDSMAREIREEVRGSARTLREELRNAARDIRREQRRENRKDQGKPFGDLLGGGKLGEAIKFAETLGASREWLNRVGAGWCEDAGESRAEAGKASSAAGPTAAPPTAPAGDDTRATTERDTAERESTASDAEQPHPTAVDFNTADPSAGAGPTAQTLDLALLDFVEAVRGAARGARPDPASVAECHQALAEARQRIQRALGARD